MAAQTVGPTDEELLQAQADLWRHSLRYFTPFALRCAVELGIPTAIHRLGRAASPSDLITALSLPSAKLPFLRRLLRLLGAAGIFAVDKSTNEELYGINPISYLLVDGIPDEVHINHTSLVLANTSKRYIDAAMGLADWFKKDVVTPPFEELHSATLFHESLESLDPDHHKVVNEALHAHDNFGIPIALREFRELFKGIKSITYCCGVSGDDTFPKALVKAFPHIKYTARTVLDYLDQKRIQNLFLLGPPGAGTRTIFKLAKYLYGTRFTQEELEGIKLMIQSNMFKYVVILLEGRERFEKEALSRLNCTTSEGEETQHDDNKANGSNSCTYSINVRLKRFSDWLLDIIEMVDLDAFFPAATREYPPFVDEMWRDPASTSIF